MLRQIRLLIGISLFWLALSMLSDGINTLVLPLQLSILVGRGEQATVLGLLTFVGLLAGALIQPVAGALSDRLRPSLGRKGFIGIGVLLSLAALALFAIFRSLVGVMVGYLAIQAAASLAQAGQQGLIPDLVKEPRRGLASGLKGFMDITGAMLGFAILGQLLGNGRVSFALGAIAIALVIVYILSVLLTREDHGTHNATVSSRAVSITRSFQIDVRKDNAFVRLLLARFLFLLGIYATGRFLLFFVADRLGLAANEAAQQAGNLLAALALITILASPLAGWLADRVGRLPLMLAGSLLGATSALMLIWAHSSLQILLFGGLMSLGSAAFAGGSWALLADLVPKEESARYFGLANFSTAGSAAVAGLLGPVLDWWNYKLPGSGYTILFFLAALSFIVSAFPLRESSLPEVRDVRDQTRNEGEASSNNPGLAVLSISAGTAPLEEDQNPQGGSASP